MGAPGPQGQRWEAPQPAKPPPRDLHPPRHGDLENQGIQRALRFREKGGKQREVPVRPDLDRCRGGIRGNIVERIFV